MSKAVREGRRREFRHFQAFADASAAARIPDPTDEKTFLTSKIDWSEATREPHARVLAQLRDLIAIRTREIVPLLSSRYLGGRYEVVDGVLKVDWGFAAGGLGFAANFSDSVRDTDLPSGAHPIWQSDSARVESTKASLESWTGISWKVPA